MHAWGKGGVGGGEGVPDRGNSNCEGLEEEGGGRSVFGMQKQLPFPNLRDLKLLDCYRVGFATERSSLSGTIFVSISPYKLPYS